MLDDQQIQQRRPVWIALSELWLDTDLSSEDLERIARVLAESALSVEELRRVYLVEVAPVVSQNLRSVAGEWMGFDEGWLCSEIIRHLRDCPRRNRFLCWFPPTRKAMLHATGQHWTRLIALVTKFRNQAPARQP